MQTALEFYGLMPQNFQLTIASMSWLLTELPDKPGAGDATLWSCHGLTRAMKELFELSEWTIHDGFFNRKGICHSWLVNESKELIFDIYPMGGYGGPILLDVGAFFSPWRGLYIEARQGYYDAKMSAFEAEGHEIVRISRKVRQNGKKEVADAINAVS